ncbi:aminotransferase class III-fold pyridoxal phosphate-dependent enzyme [Falsiroseomonas selenitidurans]|uniref:Aminotransferase class III-fold pyridoxal phosphate-dependent enzyme n=1 Tax=Falsiroseomonas selenitidurans TaxID=2716335 RepID=A0ABX1E5W5_9PROT|nr:aminotransferase class III-fold pyridoxal phosphate-dependent enzyme [Falsiroseomonas selenitidurans]NKC31178.1 aminotransferase class III-fold pyridoxal phosphate-dependent enzyme [Falsiroseomonas selenitidurans]
MPESHFANTSRDAALRERAGRVIPGGLWGHLNAARLPEGYPQYYSRAEGCRLWDADGREVVDFMSSWGPIVLGHHHPAVEEAAQRQAALGDCMNGPAPVLVDLAERLVETIPHAAWCLLSKNGTDATTACVTIARAGTGRRKLLVARGSYHGAVPWCSPSMAGVTAEDRAHLLFYDYNDADSVRAAAEAARGDLAGILVTAFRHDMARTLDLPAPGFAQALRTICDDQGAALILDDVRAGFRLHLGGSWETLGVRPDLAAYSKAIANGHPLAAVTGREWLRRAATEVFTTGSFWCGAVPMAAALATIAELHRIDGPARMRAMGQRLRDGLAAGAERHGLAILQSGPPQMPLLQFERDVDFRLGEAFCAAALAAGAYFHPRHNMFLNCAHDAAAVDRGLAAAEEGFAAVARLSP